MSERRCYVCERAIAHGERAVIEYVDVDEADATVVVEVLRHPGCEPRGGNE